MITVPYTSRVERGPSETAELRPDYVLSWIWLSRVRRYRFGVISLVCLGRERKVVAQVGGEAPLTVEQLHQTDGGQT